LLIDLRPIQKGIVNGVTISSINFIQDYIDSQKYNIILWSNQIKKSSYPKKWLLSKNVTHIQTRIPNKILNLVLSKTNLVKIDKLLKRKIDYYFCPDLRPFHFSKKVKTAIYIHDIAFKKYPEFYSFKSKLWYKLINPKLIYKKANLIYTNSSFSKKELVKNYGNKKIIIKPPYLAANWGTFKEIKINNKKPYILTISSLQPRKNLKNLIKGFNIFNKDNNFDLYIAGIKESNFPNTKLPKQKNIKFLGKINETKKKNLILNTKLLLYLPIYEGFGLPILEAITLNTEVLANNLIVFHESFLNQQKHINYCDASDPNKIAKKIKEILA